MSHPYRAESKLRLLLILSPCPNSGALKMSEDGCVSFELALKPASHATEAFWINVHLHKRFFHF